VYKYENNAIAGDNAVTFEERRIVLAFITLKHVGAIFRVMMSFPFNALVSAVLCFLGPLPRPNDAQINYLDGSMKRRKRVDPA